MRGRIAWQGAAVERDARPVDDLTIAEYRAAMHASNPPA